MGADIDVPVHVREFILSNNMVRKGDKVVVAFSGGPDSTVMLHILYVLSKEIGFSLHIAYLNHMLRKRAEEEALWAQSVALELSVDFSIGRYPVSWLSAFEGMSVEDAARITRYGFLEDVKKRVGANKIAVAHNMDDHVETVLLKIIRGCSMSGLVGIKPVSGDIIRPLLCMSKEEIFRFCERYGLLYRVDETNADTSYLRNRIRLQLLPFLRRNFNPNIAGALIALSKSACVEDEFIRECAQGVFGELFRLEDGELVASVNAFLEQHISMQYRLLLMAFGRLSGSLSGLSRKHLDAMLSIVMSGSGYKEIKLPNGVIFRKMQGKIYLSKRAEDIPPVEYDFCPPYELNTRWGSFSATLMKPPLDSSVVGKDMNVGYFDAEKLLMPLVIRNRRHGDRFRPFGMNSTMKLKKFFINEKILYTERNNTPLLVSGDDIVWVVGVRVSDKYKVTDSTRSVLRVEFKRQTNSP